MAAFPGKKVTSEMPSTRPDEFFTIDLAGNDYPNPAFTMPRPLIGCWAKTAERAEQLACEAVTVLRNAKGLFGGAQVKGMYNIQGPVPLNDPDIQDRRRFQFHGDLYIATR